MTKTIPLFRTLFLGFVFTILCSATCLFSYGQLAGLTEKISISLKNTTAAKVILELDKQSAYTFSYSQTQLEKIPVASFVYDNTTLGKALQNLGIIGNLEFSTSTTTIAVKIAGVKQVTPVAPRVRPGKIAGVIRDEKNEVMPGVSIMVENINKGATTVITGDYTVEIQPGTYTVLVSYVGYGSRRITDVVVKENEITDLSITLNRESDTKQLQTVVITSGARRESIRSLLMVQKNSAAMTDGISAEQIRVTPDNNTAQILKRVSGVTVQNEKFVTIRGVSDRYNNVLINGAALPSTEPNRRNFSFDIIPSALVDNIVVSKTATPDLPSEFTGGIVQINTKEIPTSNFLELTIGTGFNTASVGKKFMSYKRDEKAWLGTVDKNRKWFGDGRLFDPVMYLTKVNREHDTAYRNAVGGKIPNRWQPYTYEYRPMQNYQLTGGLSKQFAAGNSIGMVGAITYRNELFYEEGESRVLQQSDFESKRYRYATTIGSLLNIAYRTKRHRLAWKNLFNHRYSNQFDEQTGAYISVGSYSKRRGEVTLTNNLLHNRLEGEHHIGKIDLKLDWYGDHIQLIREQPDTRYITGTSDQTIVSIDDQYIDKGRYTYNFNNGTLVQNGLYSSRLDEKRRNTGLNVSLPFTVFGNKQLLKTGYSWSERKADFDGTGLKVRDAPGSSYTSTKVGALYHEIVTQEAFTSGQLEYFTAYARASTTGDKYTGKQVLQAWYGMLDLKPLKQLRLVGGLRYEQNKMTLSTIFYNNQGFAELGDTVYQEKHWLPSVNAIYSVTDKFNIRGAFGKTLSRPDFVERSPYIYYDFVELAQVIGQYELELSRTNNYDLRLEYYPTGNEIFSASVFYKEFDKPVERFYNIGTATNAIVYRNLHSATAKGFELDVRKSLAFINSHSSWLQNFYISGNFTYLKGEISYLVTRSPFTGKDTSFVASGARPIQGLSPYIINGGLNYQSKTWGFNISYNRYGRRIVHGGTNSTLIQYENPRDVVDLQLSTRLLKQKAEIKFNISDLFNQYFIIYSNNINRDGSSFPGEAANNDPKGDALNEELDLVNYKVKRGTGVSISISYKW